MCRSSGMVLDMTVDQVDGVVPVGYRSSEIVLDLGIVDQVRWCCTCRIPVK